MNVFDIRTGRPIVAPAAFARTFEVFPLDRFSKRRPMSLDLVSVVVICDESSGRQLLELATELRAEAQCVWDRAASVVGLKTRIAPDQRPVPAVWFDRYHELNADAWWLEVFMTREGARRFATECQRRGIGERIADEMVG